MTTVTRYTAAEMAEGQGETKLPDLERRLRHWAELNQGERERGLIPTFLNPWTVLGWMGVESPDFQREQATPTEPNPPPVDNSAPICNKCGERFISGLVHACPNYDQHRATTFSVHEAARLVGLIPNTVPADLHPDAAKGQVETVKQCRWTPDDDDGGYRTSCGHHWYFDEGGAPAEHKIRFCGYCAGVIDAAKGEASR